jgi:hypothetical protein
MPKLLIGCFYFTPTVYNNLLGEFTNNETDEISIETATFKFGNHFDGEYTAIWYDTDFHQGTLKINKNVNKYKLIWEENGNTKYVGEGMLLGNTLIGYYKQGKTL